MGLTTSRRSIRLTLPAGLLDAGLASLATFVIGVFAARALPARELGVYGLFFAALHTAAVLPSQLALAPAEIEALEVDAPGRIGVLRHIWVLGLPLAIVAALVATAVAALAARDAGPQVLVALGATTAVAATVSPLQDHVRRVLHLAGLSWIAAAVSGVQLLGVVIGLAALHLAGMAAEWLPLGALAIANVLSLAFGLLASSRLAVRDGHAIARPPLGRVLARGRWLLAAGLAPPVAEFIAAVLLSQLAGLVAVGQAEAARVVAQPIYVIALGVGAVLWPRSMEAAAARHRSEASRIARIHNGLLLVFSLAFAAATVVPWWGNPLAALVPAAYAVPGLVTAWVLAGLVKSMAYPWRSELIGGGGEIAVARGAVSAGVVESGLGLLSGVIGPFARPLGTLGYGAVLTVALRRPRHALYDAPATAEVPADRA